MRAHLHSKIYKWLHVSTLDDHLSSAFGNQLLFSVTMECWRQSTEVGSIWEVPTAWVVYGLSGQRLREHLVTSDRLKAISLRHDDDPMIYLETPPEGGAALS